jgi:pantoate--beta-alanine ligase
MEVVTDPKRVQAEVFRWRGEGTVGLVPTMGALHAGHLSLVHASKQSTARTVVTIFVNPTQFAPTEDLARYPRTLEEDLQLLRDAGVDLVFTPTETSMYPSGYSTYVTPGEVAQTLEGKIRPVHFRGVTTVVLKLLHIIPATHAFFGQKDYQQVCVVRQMIEDFNIATQLVVCPTTREPDGLAMSSRNRYLDQEQRHRALALSQALQCAASIASHGHSEVAQIESAMRQVLASAPVDQIDYAVVCDANTLQQLSKLDRAAVALVAARVGKTRLIDNRLLDPPNAKTTNASTTNGSATSPSTTNGSNGDRSSHPNPCLPSYGKPSWAPPNAPREGR